MANSTSFLNGVQSSGQEYPPGDPTAIPNVTNRPMCIGAPHAGISWGLGHIFYGVTASMLFFSTSHDNNTRQGVEKWLANYYGITL